MNRKILTQNTTVNLAVTGLMGALVFVATFFLKIEIPVGGDRTMIGFANVFCVLSGLILGPYYWDRFTAVVQLVLDRFCLMWWEAGSVVPR